MAENPTPQNRPDDELSVEELEDAAGGHCNTNCGTNCSCGGAVDDQPADPAH